MKRVRAWASNLCRRRRVTAVTDEPTMIARFPVWKNEWERGRTIKLFDGDYGRGTAFPVNQAAIRC